jgi:hypothetical protein
MKCNKIPAFAAILDNCGSQPWHAFLCTTEFCKTVWDEEWKNLFFMRKLGFLSVEM